MYILSVMNMAFFNKKQRLWLTFLGCFQFCHSLRVIRVTFSLQMEGIPSKARNLPMNLLLGRLYRISRHSRAAVAIYKECLRFVNISYTNWTFDMTSIGYLWMPLWIYFISFNLFVATALYIDLQPSGIMSTIILMSELIAFALFKHTFVMSVHPVTYLFLLS